MNEIRILGRVRETWWVYGATFFLCLASYYYVLDNGFLGDDNSRLLLNPELNSLWASLRGKLGDRPVLMFSLWLDTRLFGLHPAPLRILGLIYHTFVAVQLFLLLSEEGKESQHRTQKIFAVVVILFALHPLCNQALNIVVQRGVILASFFCLLSLRYYLQDLRKGSTKYIPWSLATLTLGILSKPILFFVPVYYVYLAMTRNHRKMLVRTPVFFLPLLLSVFFYFFERKNFQIGTYSSLQYLLTQASVIPHYLSKIIVPINFSYLYDFEPPKDLLFNWQWLYLATLIAGAVILYRFLRFSPARIFFVGFCLSFIPESSVFPIRHLAFDHRAYLPLLFFFATIGSLLGSYELGSKRNARSLTVFAVLAYFILNQARNFQIKPAYNWILNTLENSVNDHDNNLTMTTKLLDMKLVDELTPIIERYNERYPDLVQYQILSTAHEWLKYPERKSSCLEKLTSLGTRPDLPVYTRAWLDSFVINRLERGNSFDNQVALELFLRGQMSFLFRAFDADVFSQIREVYKTIALDLVRAQATKMSSIERLKIRIILRDYFKIPDPDLDRDLVKLSKEEPGNSIFQWIKNLNEM